MRSFLFRRPPNRRRSRGQSLVEFALVFPIFFLLLGGMIQFGMIFWGQNTLNQVVRDTGRYAATRCSPTAASESATTFNTLIASTGGPWKAPGVTVTYSPPSTCPIDNTGQVWVNVTASFDAPIFFPWVPGNGHLTSVTDFRVEPKP
jgi:Flp pilus assembly protein TadG